MKIKRSTKCSTKFMTDEKRNLLKSVMEEYSKVVNFFIEKFWDKTPKKHELAAWCNKNKNDARRDGP